MAFNSNPGRAEYTATAAQTVFPFVFKIYLDGDIKVYLTPVGSTADDTADILLITTDYTVSIDGDNGGEITLTSGATLGDSITIVRDLDVNRLIEYQNNGDLLAETLNQDQNYQTYLIADKDAENATHMKLPNSVQGVSVDLPAPFSDAYLKWNITADAIENDTTIPQAVIDAEAAATAAQLSAWEAEAEALTSDSYATEAEDTEVNIVTSDGDGTFTYTPQTGVYSSLHWAAKAATFNPSLYALLAGAIFTGQVSFAKGADVASASALPILTDGNYFDVTGTTTITSINTTGAIGTVIKLHFDGILTLTHHATDLILPSGANITTAAGDEAEFIEYASGDFRCTNYSKASGEAVIGGGGINTVDDLIIGQSISVSSWSYVTTAITINTAVPHNLNVGQEIILSGLVATTDAPNGIQTVVSVVDTDTITFTASATPTGTPTVSSALLNSGDIETLGKLKGVNACTAWVSFDGTTTPPTIKDSFNVSDVVRIATGVFDIVFEQVMDNATYATVGNSTFANSGTNARSATTAEIDTTKAYFNSIITSTGGGTNTAFNTCHIFGGKD